MRQCALNASYLFVFFIFNSTGCGPADTPPRLSEVSAIDVEENTETVAKASIYRDIQFISYLQNITGITTGDGGKDPSNHVWSVLLGYSSTDYSVEVLSRIDQVYDPETHRPKIYSSASGDSNVSNIPYTLRIVQPAFGTVPMRIFSGLAKVTNTNTGEMIVQYELIFTWENDRWRHLGHSKLELERLPTVQKYQSPNESTADDGP